TGQWIGSWTPWYGFMELPPSAAFQLPAGSHVLAEIHYRRVNNTVVDRGAFGLFFVDKPAPNTMSEVVLAAKDSGTGKSLHAETKSAADTHAVALHLDGEAKSVEVSARQPDGGTDVLLYAKDFPQDWPTPYVFKDPVLLRRGTVLFVTAYGGPVKLTVSRY